MATRPSHPLAVSLGDPAGIGPEVIAKCWDHRADVRPAAVRRDRRRAARSPRSGTARSRSSTIRAQADAAFDYGLPLIQLTPPQADVPGHPSVAGAHCSLDCARTRGRPRAVRLGVGGRHRPGRQGAALRDRLPASRPDRVRRRALRRSPGNVVMMLAGPTLRTVPVTTHLPLREVPRRADHRADRIARPSRAARAPAQFRDRRAAARRLRPQSACRRRRHSSAARRSRSSSRRSPRLRPKAGE